MTKAERFVALLREVEMYKIEPFYLENSGGSLELTCTRGYLAIRCTNGMTIPTNKIPDIIDWLNSNFIVSIDECN